MSRLYVVVSGPPGSGKTTLARPLAHALDLPLIAKDRIKGSLLDSLGVGDLEWSRLLGRATMSLMYRLAADAGAAVLESTWSPELAPAALAALDAPIVEVSARARPSLLRGGTGNERRRATPGTTTPNGCTTTAGRTTARSVSARSLSSTPRVRSTSSAWPRRFAPPRAGDRHRAVTGTGAPSRPEGRVALRRAGCPESAAWSRRRDAG